MAREGWEDPLNDVAVVMKRIVEGRGERRRWGNCCTRRVRPMWVRGVGIWSKLPFTPFVFCTWIGDVPKPCIKPYINLYVSCWVEVDRV